MSNNFNQLQVANSILENQLNSPNCFSKNHFNSNFDHQFEQQPEPKAVEHKAAIFKALLQTRLNTLNLFEDIEAHSIFANQIDPEFSPIGWHLGHIAYTEALWILAKFGGSSQLCRKYETFFANDQTYSDRTDFSPEIGNQSLKSKRTNLPELAEIFDYAKLVRSEVMEYLENHSFSNQHFSNQLSDQVSDQISDQIRTWYWLIQHEIQHCETIAFLLHLNLHLKQSNCDQIQPRSANLVDLSANSSLSISSQSAMIDIPAAEFWQGSDLVFAQDNERPRHLVKLERFAIDQNLVTVKQYQEFIANGGYDRREWWTQAGWQWLQAKRVHSPLYWHPEQEQYPVYGVSWYEANAYALAVGKRLPTEAEWERTAMELNMLGNVWQWTASKFVPYPNFKGFPYPGYSAIYFDRQHYVLRGGSWVTGSLGLRPSFRNWYHPHIRQVLAGFRCAA